MSEFKRIRNEFEARRNKERFLNGERFLLDDRLYQYIHNEQEPLTVVEIEDDPTEIGRQRICQRFKLQVIGSLGIILFVSIGSNEIWLPPIEYKKMKFED